MKNKITHYVYISLILIIFFIPSTYPQKIQSFDNNPIIDARLDNPSGKELKDSNTVIENDIKEETNEDINTEGSTCIITMHRMVDGGLSSSVQRRVQIAKEKNIKLLIFDINTFGGRLDSAIDISEHVSTLKDIKTVAYISHKAISAGALIAISCNDIYMAPEAEFGDCEPIIPSSEGGYKTAGEKIQTVLRTKFRKFAEKNGYPVLLAEAMVTSDIEVYKVITDKNPEGIFISSRELKDMKEIGEEKIKKKELIVEEGKLLTMHSREAFEYGFARQIVDDQDSLLKLYKIDRKDVIELETNWSEEMVRFLEKLAPILLTIGIIAIYLEFKVPGFGLPGIIGILCFATIFLSKYLVGLADAPEIIIFFVGIALIAVEIFLIPGFGIAGIVGIVSVFIGLILSFQDFAIPRTPYDTQILQKNLLMVIVSFLCSSFVIILLLKYMPGIPIFNRLILATAETPTYGFFSETTPAQSKLIGDRGVALTPLHPSGRIEIGDKILDAVTEGNFIEKGQPIEIVEVEGNRIVVKAV